MEGTGSSGEKGGVTFDAERRCFYFLLKAPLQNHRLLTRFGKD